MNNIKFTATYMGQGDKEGWKHFQWSISINGVSFQFNTGLGHITPYYKKHSIGKNPKPANSLANADLQGWLHVPTLESVLECLFSDADCGTQSFNDFCDNMGYSTDSLKALDIYRECMEVAPKLRKALGNEYNAALERIQELNQ